MSDTIVKFDPTSLDALDQNALLLRRQQLIDKGNGKPQDLGDEELTELCAIFALLRRRASGPPKLKPATAKQKASAVIPDLF